MLTGSIVALVTPMREGDAEIDYEALAHLIEWHIEEGTDAIVVAGTTGESAALSFTEHHQLVSSAVELARGRIPIIAGTGSNNTREAIRLTEGAKRVGADYALSVVPYYNKPSQEGMYRHFKSIADAVDLPLILYNVPGRTVVDLQNDTVLKLAEHPNIVGLKDATGCLARAGELFRRVPSDFLLYSGDDPSSLAYMLLGGHGVVSVCANLVPKLFRQMCHAALEKNCLLARDFDEKLQLIYPLLFCEPSPAPVKWALHRMHHCHYRARLPVVDLSFEARGLVEKMLQSLQLI
ncbi:MAG: 4-hydroxy-tetrahydrodipicolinate synthase [Neisseriaceae bacterium]